MFYICIFYTRFNSQNKLGIFFISINYFIPTKGGAKNTNKKEHKNKCGE